MPYYSLPIFGSTNTNHFVTGLASNMASIGTEVGINFVDTSTTPAGSDPQSVFSNVSHTFSNISKAVLIQVSVSYSGGSPSTRVTINLVDTTPAIVASNISSAGSSGIVTLNYATSVNTLGYHVTVSSNLPLLLPTLIVSVDTFFKGTWG